MSEKGAGGLVEAMVCFCRTVRSPGFCPLSEFSPLRAPVLQRPFSFFDKRREAGGGGPDLHASAAAAGSEPRPEEMKRCLFCLHQIHALSFLRPRPRVKPACLRMLFTPSELRSRLGSMSGSPQRRQCRSGASGRGVLEPESGCSGRLSPGAFVTAFSCHVCRR